MTFYRWLVNYKDQTISLGDLARDAQRDRAAPRKSNAHPTWQKHMEELGACENALRTLDEAYRLYIKEFE